MNALGLGTPFEQTARDNYADDAAYFSGYADGITLLHANADNHLSIEPFQRTHGRYLCYAGLVHPSPEARAYIAGFRDVAADNLPCPPHDLEPHAHRLAA